MVCSVQDCLNDIYAKGLCKKHHNSAWLETRPGYANQARKKYRDANPDKMKHNHRRLNGRFSNGKTQAKRKNVVWNITIEEYKKLIAQNCRYCDGNLNETGSGLDRIDNKKGYELSNVVACCWSCNTIKGRIEGLGFSSSRTIELIEELIKLKFEKKYKELHK